MVDRDLVQKRQSATESIYGSPYNALHYIDRASIHEQLNFPDLAAADAYKALLLSDELRDDSGEYHEVAVEAVSGQTSTESHEEIASRVSLQAYSFLIRNLIACGCLKPAFEFSAQGLRAFPDDAELVKAQDTIKSLALARRAAERSPETPSEDRTDAFDLSLLSEAGFARREVYPWNEHEPDRLDPEYVENLNRELKSIAPKCSVRPVKLPTLTDRVSEAEGETCEQLGLVADVNIAPGEVLLTERSVLAVNNRLHDPLCDACSAELSPASAFACSDCDDTVFCSQQCMDTAMEVYHPSVCGTDVDSVARDTEPKEAADSLYLLLVGRALALAVTQDVHPLELKETQFLWGDFDPPESSPRLPFSFKYNIAAPIHILEKMEIDIFSEVSKFDAWIINTMYAKFRGVASGRVNPRTGVPEVCAVHPFWCLANHSCAPNVRWEWGAEIRFWARTEEELIKWSSDSVKAGGVKAGEEILNHYCDVSLDVKERRDWAKGALGGDCMCPRCIWESNRKVVTE